MRRSLTHHFLIAANQQKAAFREDPTHSIPDTNQLTATKMQLPSQVKFVFHCMTHDLWLNFCTRRSWMIEFCESFDAIAWVCSSLGTLPRVIAVRQFCHEYLSRCVVAKLELGMPLRHVVCTGGSMSQVNQLRLSVLFSLVSGEQFVSKNERCGPAKDWSAHTALLECK